MQTVEAERFIFGRNSDSLLIKGDASVADDDKKITWKVDLRNSFLVSI